MIGALPSSEVDLNLLYTFRAVIEHGSIGAAARALGRTQPAVTSRIKQLERDLGVPLFERAGRGVRLSSFGHAIEPDARKLMTNVLQLLERVQAASSEPTGTLRLGTLPMVSAVLLTDAIARFAQRNPRARVIVRHGTTAGQLFDLAEGKVDVVVSVGGRPEGSLETAMLGHVTAALVMRASEAPRGKVSLARLRTMPYLDYGKTGDFFFDAVERFVERHRLAAGARIEVPHILTIKSLIAAGAGVSILPSYIVTERTLVARPVESLNIRFPIWMATRARAGDVPLIREFCRSVRANMGEKVAGKGDRHTVVR